MDPESVKALKDLLGTYGGMLPFPLWWVLVGGLFVVAARYLLPAVASVISAWRGK